MRNRHVKYRKGYKQAAKELNDMKVTDLAEGADPSTNGIVQQITKEINIIEKKINQLIYKDNRLNRLYNCITRVPVVGKVIAWTVIIKTNEFKTINDPRKLACFAGVVPFESQSGSSIYRKPRVSFMADKALKKILTMGAIRVIQLEGELAEYYQRKVLEGKNKMSVINAIRNKLIARICSCVNNDRLYVKRLDLS
ncbi:MAG: transposase [Flavobacteriaceae bacterium]|jgi:transposase